MAHHPFSRAFRRLVGEVRRLRRNVRGNVLIITAFALVPLTFATGMGVDYSHAMRLQTKLNAVSDAAALSAVTQPMLQQPILNACSTARKSFTTQAGAINDGLALNVLDPAQVAIVISETYASGSPVTLTCPLPGETVSAPTVSPLSRAATVTYRGEATNAFAGILGVASLTVKGTATATVSRAPYVDIHLALDTSQSMGLAASDADAKLLWQKTGEINGRSCQFGCHERSYHNGVLDSISNEQVAINNNIKMRIDVLRTATTDMIDTAIQNQGTNNSYQFSLYRIGKNAGRYATGVDLYAPLTTDLAAVRLKVQSLTLSANDGYVGFGDTDLPAINSFVLPYVNATSATYDDGRSQARARKFYFIVTDGVTDLENSSCVYGHCTRAMDPSTCNAYKQKGITVGIVYTTYLPTKSNPLNPNDTGLRDEYIKLIQPIATQIAPALQACASPGYYFEASDGPTIHAAMQKLFAQATKTTTITR